MRQGNIVEKIGSTIKGCMPSDKAFIALHEPVFQGNEWNYVKECLDTGWVSSVGKYVDRFEEMLCEYTGVKRAVAVVNGTAALHICLKLVGVERNDEVLLPALTFIATANAISYTGAIPHFVDSCHKTLGLDPKKLGEYLQEIAEVKNDGCYNKQTGRRIKAVVPMHTFGHPVDLDTLMEVCDRFRLELIEDAAESLGSFYKGRHTGNWGRVSALSFNGNKITTTGGGGAILTNDEELGKWAKHLTTTAKLPHKWEFVHDEIGYNYRMPNINAALGCAQLERLPDLVKQKRMLATVYQQAFSTVEGVVFFSEPDFAVSNYWLNAIKLAPEWSHLRDEILQTTNEQGLMTRPIWKLLCDLGMYEGVPKMDLTVARELESTIINIPSSAFLGAAYV
ncbi:LegC family aminotransferase [Brevibacillus antibioticus]|uniref:LegC family aminotransferase n=1 Tax=Brevibacillus antibioticus TaxID=2570228 RepID=A0A4U2YCL5_9BACL|nr:LegC family aminotransferase [Brevibacillus antibioticus]TKI58587.1 LegC family aminotransferase [Brevibacillus antibioticus]